MSRRSDLTDQLFGRLLAKDSTSVKRGGKTRMLWRCVCECGNTVFVVADNLKSGHTQSCGCLRIEVCSQTGLGNTTHGASRTLEYKIHESLVRRASNPSHKAFPTYGAAGRTVCKYFRVFTNFDSLLGRKPTPKHSIDRIENSGGYWCGKCEECVTNKWPMNVRWATPEEQRQNMDDIKWLTINNETRCIADWERQAGLKPDRIRARIKAGWPIDESLLQPPKYNGKKAA